MSISARQAAEELARRALAQTGASGVIAAIRAELFDKQVAFLEDPSRNKAALCTRRAGKTSMWSRYCTIEALRKPKSLIRVWGVSRLRTKQLLWEEFKDVHARHQIRAEYHETELNITLDNGSQIRLLGADKDKEAQKKRGDKTVLEVVLEAQLFGPFLRTLVEDVAEPCLLDMQGTICMEGTPGVVPTGYWFYVTGDVGESPRWQSEGRLVASGVDAEKELVGAGWSCHHWSLLDNPHLPHAAEELDRIRKKRSWTVDSPTYVREYLGKWVVDGGVLFYKYNEARNGFSSAEIQPYGPGWKHVLGWDLGARDDMALVSWGWHPSKRNLFEAASWKKPGASSAEVMAKIDEWVAMGMDFVAMVADTGGGGRMYVDDVSSRFQKTFKPAQKAEKLNHVRMMNDELLSGVIKVQRGSPLALEYEGLPKDPDWDPDSGKPPGEDPRFPNHCTDAALYAWREAFPHLDFQASDDAAHEDDPFVAEIERKQIHSEELEWWEQTDGNYE